MLRKFDETLSTKSNKIAITEIYDHLKEYANIDELVKLKK